MERWMKFMRTNPLASACNTLRVALLSMGLLFLASSMALSAHFEAGGTSDAAAKQKIEDCMKRLNPEVAAMVQEVIDKTPILANDVQAQLGFMAMLQNESNFRNQAYGRSTVCPGLSIAYGYTQVTYRDFNNEISKAMGTTSKLDALRGTGKAWDDQYCKELEVASKWMMANPGETFRIGSQEYIQRLAHEKGDVMTALNKVCAGDNLAKNKDLCIRTAKGTGTYEQAIQRAIAGLSQCSSDDGAGVDYGGYQSSTTGTSSFGRAPEVFECQDVKLSDALEKAQVYFNAASAVASRTASEEGERAARENMGKVGNVFDSVNNRLCFSMLEHFNSLVETLLGIAGTILNMLIGFINQLISLACQYVVAAITNVLASICIPLPDLPSMPGFGSGPERKSCNGLSMADLVSMSSHPAQLTPSQLGIADYQKAIRNKATDTVTRGFNAITPSSPLLPQLPSFSSPSSSSSSSTSTRQ